MPATLTRWPAVAAQTTNPTSPDKAALPNTKVTGRVPLVTYYMAVSGYKDAARGVVPDYPVTHTIDDLIAGRDKDMELALRLARKEAR